MKRTTELRSSRSVSPKISYGLSILAHAKSSARHETQLDTSSENEQQVQREATASSRPEADTQQKKKRSSSSDPR